MVEAAKIGDEQKAPNQLEFVHQTKQTIVFGSCGVHIARGHKWEVFVHKTMSVKSCQSDVVSSIGGSICQWGKNGSKLGCHSLPQAKKAGVQVRTNKAQAKCTETKTNADVATSVCPE